MKVLITGVAGFIGMHLTKRLIAQGDEVFGVDNLNDYYDPTLKQARLDQLKPLAGFGFEKMDIADRDGMAKLFQRHSFDAVVNLAAQAGVRYSLTNPHAYVDANIVGFMNVLEGCRHAGVKHLVYASSSSVYGGNTQMPFSEHQGVDHPVSLYAATKKANELMAHTYSHLYRLPTTGLRFFTVYGPWGRPDMALFMFTKAILEGRAIDVFNHGRMQRDFTYIDDIVSGIVGVMSRPAQPNLSFDASQPDTDTSHAPFRIFNIGNQGPVELMEFVNAIETALGTEAIKNMMALQPGDVPATYADVSELTAWTGVSPGMPIREGVSRFVDWYRQYHGV